MSGQPAASAPAAPRVLVVDGDRGDASLDVFEVLELGDDLVRVRSPLLFELGEELRVRIERGGQVQEANARVRAHVGSGTDLVTELELSDHTEPRHVVSG
ncbi:MAG TPA: hypothetical protein VLX92_12065 [Kofleriaceae bacterium]|nr:hypothetical protein [Kofleriaceae bacterium]